MRKMRTQISRHARTAFTAAELLIVIIIIALLSIISISAYRSVLVKAQERSIRATLATLAAAAQVYYDENHDYPAMRFGDMGLTPSKPFPATPLPNADQSIAALIYQLQYHSTAGEMLDKLPSSVLVPLNMVPVEWPDRPLYTIRDPWRNAVQYLRPRGADALSAANLSSRVLLVSMGKDGMPGQEGTDEAKWDDPDDGSDTEYPHPAILKLGKGDDILVHVGSAP